MGGCGNVNCSHCSSTPLPEPLSEATEYKVGDVLEDCYGDKTKILAVGGIDEDSNTRQYLISKYNKFDEWLGIHTEWDLTHHGYHLPRPLPEPLSEATGDWEDRFDKELGRLEFEVSGHYGDFTPQVKAFILSELARAVEEERQFVLNVLDGVDVADEQMGNKGGGTKAIRHALASRVI